jgi:sulfoacetaldehyde acetyltransferase
VLHPSRIAEVLNRVIVQAKRASAPAQVNVPRDFWTQVIDIEMPPVIEFERPAGGEERHCPAPRSCFLRPNSL